MKYSVDGSTVRFPLEYIIEGYNKIAALNALITAGPLTSVTVHLEREHVIKVHIEKVGKNYPQGVFHTSTLALLPKEGLFESVISRANALLAEEVQKFLFFEKQVLAVFEHRPNLQRLLTLKKEIFE